jgi:hypothetical protein
MCIFLDPPLGEVGSPVPGGHASGGPEQAATGSGPPKMPITAGPEPSTPSPFPSSPDVWHHSAGTGSTGLLISQCGLEAPPSQSQSTVVKHSDCDCRGGSSVCAEIVTAAAVVCKGGCSTCVYTRALHGPAASVQQPPSERLPVPELAEKGNAKSQQLHH